MFSVDAARVANKVSYIFDFRIVVDIDLAIYSVNTFFNNEHHGTAALTDTQHEIKWVKHYNETLKTILHYAQ